ncbi:MAG: hypothetical protein WCG55_04285 [bacterium]
MKLETIQSPEHVTWKKIFTIDDDFEKEVAAVSLSQKRLKNGAVLRYGNGPESTVPEELWKILETKKFQDEYGPLAEITGGVFESADASLGQMLKNYPNANGTETLHEMLAKGVLRDITVIHGRTWKDAPSPKGQSHDYLIKAVGETVEPENLLIGKIVYVRSYENDLDALATTSHELIHTMTSHLTKIGKVTKNQPDVKNFLFPEEQIFFAKTKKIYEEFILCMEEKFSHKEIKDAATLIKNGDWEKVSYTWNMDETMARCLQVSPYEEVEDGNVFDNSILQNGKSFKSNLQDIFSSYLDFIQANPNRIKDYTTQAQHMLDTNGDPLIKKVGKEVLIGKKN